MASSGMLHRVDLVRTDVSEELSAGHILVSLRWRLLLSVQLRAVVHPSYTQTRTINNFWARRKLQQWAWDHILCP
jgi:hypothetical protein